MIVRRAVEAFGADYAQWRVLTRTMLKCDFRSASGLNLTNPGARNSGNKAVWASFVMYALYGLILTAFSTVIPGLLLSGTVLLTMTAVMVGLAVLIDFQSVVISPNDYEILAHQPVSSRTYFLVKLTNVLTFTLVIGTLIGGPSTIVFLVKFGPLVAAGWLLAIVGIVVATTLAMVSVYAGLLRVAHPQRLRRVISYVHVVMMIAIIGGPVYLGDLLEALFVDPVSGGAAAATPQLLLLAPPAWFASFLPLLAGEWSLSHALAALGGVGAIALLLLHASRRLSLSYAEQIGAMAAASERPRKSSSFSGTGLSRFSPEFNVVATLVRGQFRDDMTFRLGILAVVPATLLYFFMGVRNGPLPDPFIQLGFASGGLWLLHFAAIVFPLSVLETLFRSESFAASWIFFAAPTDRAKLVVNAGICVVVFFVAPFSVLMAGIFAWSFGNLWHAAGHALVLALFAHLGIQLILLAAPRLPFAQPPQTGARMAVILPMIAAGVMIAVILPLLLWVGYSRTEFALGLIGLLALAGVFMPLGVQKAIRSRVERLEFAG